MWFCVVLTLCRLLSVSLLNVQFEFYRNISLQGSSFGGLERVLHVSAWFKTVVKFTRLYKGWHKWQTRQFFPYPGRTDSKGHPRQFIFHAVLSVKACFLLITDWYYTSFWIGHYKKRQWRQWRQQIDLNKNTMSKDKTAVLKYCLCCLHCLVTT